MTGGETGTEDRSGCYNRQALPQVAWSLKLQALCRQGEIANQPNRVLPAAQVIGAGF